MVKLIISPKAKVDKEGHELRVRRAISRLNDQEAVIMHRTQAHDGEDYVDVITYKRKPKDAKQED